MNVFLRAILTWNRGSGRIPVRGVKPVVLQRLSRPGHLIDAAKWAMPLKPFSSTACGDHGISGEWFVGWLACHKGVLQNIESSTRPTTSKFLQYRGLYKEGNILFEHSLKVSLQRSHPIQVDLAVTVVLQHSFALPKLQRPQFYTNGEMVWER